MDTWLTKWKSRFDIERQFSPSNWGYTLSNVAKAYEADCPTLVEYEAVYGNGASVDWVYIQMLALFGSSACKDVGIGDGIRLFSESFAMEVKAYKLSELMLFFARYRAGKYDNSFSSFDTKRIGNSFFTQFLRERRIEIESIERMKEKEAIEKRSFIPPKGYTSLSWYQELKKRAKNGDMNAIKVLTNNN